MINNIFNGSSTYVSTLKDVKKNNNKDVEKTVKNEQTDKTQNITDSYDKKVSDNERKKQVSYLINQAEQQTKKFEKLVSSIFSKQSNKVGLVNMYYDGNLKNFYQNLTVDAKTIEKAKQDIDEDGYYGVNQTSERILSFAKAIAGDDPKKIQEMRDAVEKGFKKAEQMWGDKLPDISQRTYDKVMSTFDEWQGKVS
mgnify:FL=1